MAKTATVEDKLRDLYNLQIIDSRIDEIRIIRGELPLEVQDLEDEIEGMQTKLAKFQLEYGEQQNKVRNNREFESINKEIEFQELEIQLAEKRIKEYYFAKEKKQEVLDGADGAMQEIQTDLDIKKGELDEIIKETEKEEEFLVKKSESLEKKIDDRLLKAYSRIRNSSKNGLAVVCIDREASAGSFIKIPPQMQLDVAARKKIIVDEHSGRILVDKELAEEQKEKMTKELDKELKK